MQRIAITEREAAASTGVSLDTFKRMRRTGEGPPWIRVGARSVRYPVTELRRWVAEQAERAS